MGEVNLESGLIIAERHVHMTKEDAKKKIKNNLSVIDGYAESLQEAKKEGDKASEIKLNSLIERLEDENKYLIEDLTVYGERVRYNDLLLLI